MARALRTWPLRTPYAHARPHVRDAMGRVTQPGDGIADVRGREHRHVARRSALVGVLLVTTLAVAACGPLPPTGRGTSTFEARRAQALGAIAEVDVSNRINAKVTYWAAQAKLAAGKVDEGLDVLEATLANRDGAMFRMWALADTYGRWRHMMTDAMKTSAESQLVGYRYYSGGSTINHRLMYATARYLASGYFPGGVFAGDFATGDPTGRQHLLNAMRGYARYGLPEFDSPNYSSLYLSVAQTLADLSPDADVRDAARVALDSLLRSFAGEWLDGHLLSGSLRDKRAADGQFDFQGGDYILWLYTGGRATPDLSGPAIQDESGLAHLVVHLIGNYVSPLTLLERIGQERTQRTYTHYDTDVWGSRRYHQTAFVNRTYGLYSTYENYEVHSGYSNQFHRWGVRWSSASDVSSFWVKHPHRDTGTEGTTGYEKVLQCRGTLVGLYNVATSYPVQHVEGHIPTGSTAVIDDSEAGAVYLHFDSVLIGLRTTSGFAWRPGDTSFRLQDPRAAFVVETARPGEYAGTPIERLRSFRQDVERNGLVAVPGSRLSYVSRSGTALTVTATGERTVGGTRVDLGSWPLVADPWVTQALGSPTAGAGGGWSGPC